MNVSEAHELAARAAKHGIRMTFSTAKPRRLPIAGDRRTTKRHGEQVRVHSTHNGMWIVSGSRYVYDWVSINDPRAAQYVKAAK
ncbi:MAG: hypothetical protein H7255_08870 [Ramlibacter sp.]|nr:hypothetical protein [Ramlibacter sp.]